ncbi:MAG TPA: 7,8-didemethyl-8-hydroxy-5-deazariboflavin synthase CofG [Polyangia bacterium]|nr:7,8-didemethyl-8-hydroxy-5-deazariboflavin synthase CofG [Polyangia bacterium]
MTFEVARLALARAAAGESLEDEEALALAEASDAELPQVLGAATARRDLFFGRRVTFSPKVFLPLTNLCRNACDYCSFRRTPRQAGAWTMSPEEVVVWLERGREQGCAEALFCLGDTPESAFPEYRRQLASWEQASTVEYLHYAGRLALERGLLPHTNAGLLDEAAMVRLKEVNVSLGLMLESVSPRLGLPGMPHHRAPDKRPELRLAMMAAAGRLEIPFTTGILIGIGETRRERAESLLAIRRLAREHGHVQEVIVQNFRAHPGTPMASAPEPADLEIAHAVALARLILDAEVSVQAPPNLNPGGTALLLGAGINDFGGISPVTPDYINPRHAWPHVDALRQACAEAGFSLVPRLAIYDRFLARPGFLDGRLRAPVAEVAARLAKAAPGGAGPAGEPLPGRSA